MVKAVLANTKQDKLREYNRCYYQKNKERLLMYNKIYNTIQKEKNLDYLKKYYDDITSNEKSWQHALPTANSTRPKRTKLRYDRGKKVIGFERRVGPIQVTFD